MDAARCQHIVQGRLCTRAVQGLGPFCWQHARAPENSDRYTRMGRLLREALDAADELLRSQAGGR